MYRLEIERALPKISSWHTACHNCKAWSAIWADVPIFHIQELSFSLAVSSKKTDTRSLLVHLRILRTAKCFLHLCLEVSV